MQLEAESIEDKKLNSMSLSTMFKMATINYETGQATKNKKLVAAIRIFMNIMKNCVKHTFKEI